MDHAAHHLDVLVLLVSMASTVVWVMAPPPPSAPPHALSFSFVALTSALLFSCFSFFLMMQSVVQKTASGIYFLTTRRVFCDMSTSPRLFRFFLSFILSSLLLLFPFLMLMCCSHHVHTRHTVIIVEPAQLQASQCPVSRPGLLTLLLLMM